MHTMWAIPGGVRDFGSLGMLAFADIGSPVQLVLDVEMMTFFERLLQGIVLDRERIAEEVIEAVAPTGARFIDTDHTAGFFRDELWLPELLDRRAPMAWVEDPRTMLENATAKAKRLLQRRRTNARSLMHKRSKFGKSSPKLTRKPRRRNACNLPWMLYREYSRLSSSQ